MTDKQIEIIESALIKKVSNDGHYKLFSRLIIERWQHQRVRLNSGATEQELVDFEKLLSVNLPADFRYFYSLVNGMNDVSDEHLFQLWSLSEITTANEGITINEPPFIAKTAIIFGDYLINSHRYFLVIENSGDSFVVDDHIFEEKLANSFTHFLELYLTEPEIIHLWI